MLFVSCWKSLWRCFVAVITVFLEKLRSDQPLDKQEHDWSFFLHNLAVFMSKISVNIRYFWSCQTLRCYWLYILNTLQWALIGSDENEKKESSGFKSLFVEVKNTEYTLYFCKWERKVLGVSKWRQVYFLEFSCFGLPNLNWLPLICLEKHPFMPNWFSLRGRDKIFVHDIDDYLGNDNIFH